MLLAVDIGNLTVAVGLFQGKKLVRGWKIMTDREKTSDEYEVLLVNLFQYAKIDLEKVEGVILSSVVPPLTPVFQAASENLFREKALVVGPGLRTGMAPTGWWLPSRPTKNTAGRRSSWILERPRHSMRSRTAASIWAAP